jgi:hypothetical protein
MFFFSLLKIDKTLEKALRKPWLWSTALSPIPQGLHQAFPLVPMGPILA